MIFYVFICPHLYWRYNPVWVHPRTPRILSSFSTVSSHLRLGLLALLGASGLEQVSFLLGDVPFALAQVS
jgi:hypothetical protein